MVAGSILELRSYEVGKTENFCFFVVKCELSFCLETMRLVKIIYVSKAQFTNESNLERLSSSLFSIEHR